MKSTGIGTPSTPRVTIGGIGVAVAVVLDAFAAMAQAAIDIREPAAVVPLASEPAPKIVVDPALTEPLAHGRVVIQYRAENLRIMPVFGPNALTVSPRIDPIHGSDFERTNPCTPRSATVRSS